MDFKKYETTLPYAGKAVNEMMHKAYHTDIAEKREMFEKDLLDEFRLKSHPKSREILNYVWEKGHDEGFAGVYGKLDDMMSRALFDTDAAANKAEAKMHEFHCDYCGFTVCECW